MKKKSEISVVMSVYNGGRYIAAAIDSTLNQSFGDFEFIIVDDGSTDDTVSIIRNFDDERIKLIQNNHNYIDSLNVGINYASGEYIVRMDADDIMHVDRLKIQHAIMEEEPGITVCGTWMRRFGANISSDNLVGKVSGLIENPLIRFTQGDCIANPTSMIRTAFLREHKLQYENYAYAEDFKFWAEVAKLGGQFYIDSQPLLYYRISESQVSALKASEQKRTTELIIKEIMEYLIMQRSVEYPELKVSFETLEVLNNKGLMTKQEIINLFQNIFKRIRMLIY